MDSGGGRPPWVRADSTADIVISNATRSALTATLETYQVNKDVEVEADGDWVSENIIPAGKSTDVTVTTESGLEAHTKWEAEDANDQVLIHVVTEEEIRTHTSYKSD